MHVTSVKISLSGSWEGVRGQVGVVASRADERVYCVRESTQSCWLEIDSLVTTSPPEEEVSGGVVGQAVEDK